MIGFICLSVEPRPLSSRGKEVQAEDSNTHVAVDLVANAPSRMVDWGRQREVIKCGIWRLALMAPEV